jgi:hypothetical protein
MELGGWWEGATVASIRLYFCCNAKEESCGAVQRGVWQEAAARKRRHLSRLGAAC